MKTIFLVILFCSLPVIAAATLYTCRDSEGRLHVSDNLQSLPDECRVDAREMDAGDPGTLHFVPERTPRPADDTRARFEQQVSEEQRRQQEQRQREAEMVEQAQKLADQFQQAQLDRRNAIRRWSADSRQTIEQAAADMAVARSGKQRLLAELEWQRVSTGTAEQVRTTLDQITDP